MKKLIVILVILVLIFGGISAWAVNVYAKPLDIGDLKAVVVPDEAGVFLKSGEGEFQKVTGETDLKVGDTVKTDETGSARIILFDTNEVTLDKNSEVTVEESFIDQETPFFTKIKLNLKSGQIWNRLLELLHPDAYFEVESGGVVATVRGTIFNMSNTDGTVDVSVIENSVALTQTDKTEASQILQADEGLNFNLKKLKDLREAKIEKISETIRGGAWFKNNFSADKKFKEFLQERRDNLFRQIGPLPGSKFFPARQLGEKIALLLTFDKAAKQKKMENFAARKIFAAHYLAERGDNAGALKILKSLPGKTGTAIAKRLGYYDRDFLKMQAVILKSTVTDGEFAKTYLGILGQKEIDFLNQKIEAGGFLPEWLKAILKSGREGSLADFPYLKLTEEDWVCLSKIQAKSLEMQKIVAGANPILGRLAQEESIQRSSVLGQIFTPEDITCIQKIQAKLIMPLTENLKVEPLNLNGNTNTNTNTNVNTNTNTNTNTNANTNTNQPQGPVCGDGVCEIGEGSGVCDIDCPPPPPPPSVIGLEITALPESVPSQGSSKLTAVAVWSDGKRQDVTSNVTWTVSQSVTGGSMGYVSGGMFYSSGPSGTATVRGSYASDDGTFSALINISVAASQTGATGAR